MVAINDLQDLFIDQLRDLYSAETQLTKALPKMAKAATNPQLKDAFTGHLKETEGHVQRLAQIFVVEERPMDPVIPPDSDGIAFDEFQEAAHRSVLRRSSSGQSVTVGRRESGVSIAGVTEMR